MGRREDSGKGELRKRLKREVMKEKERWIGCYIKKERVKVAIGKEREISSKIKSEVMGKEEMD